MDRSSSVERVLMAIIWPFRLAALFFNIFTIPLGGFYSDQDSTALFLAEKLFGERAVERGRKKKEERARRLRERVRGEIEELMTDGPY